MSERVLITGASGFVGFHLIEAALAKNLSVVAAVRKSSAIDHLKHLPIDFTYAAFSDAAQAQNDFEKQGYQYVIHAAGVVKAPNQQAYNQTNAALTRTLGETAAREPGFKKFVLISSLAAVGPSANDQPITEEKAQTPVTQYGKSKLLAEQYLSEIPGVPYVVLRPTAVYGPREREIFVIFKSIMRGIDPYIGRGPQQLSFVYVKDLARLTVEALFTPVTGKAYNVSDGQSYDRYALADITKTILKKDAWRIHLPLSLVHTLAGTLEFVGKLNGSMPILNRNKLAELTAANWGCNISRAKADLGFEPRFDLTLGLTETLQWYRDNRWLK